jgi:glycosyltransferase involved in cell wall biosynthesis
MTRPRLGEAQVRILHVVTRLGLGGAERVAETLASGSAARGNQVTFVPVAAVRDRAVASHMHDSLVEHGVEVVGDAIAATAKVAVLEGARRLTRTVERVRPDLVHLHTEIPEFAWALAGLQSRRVRAVPVVRTIHNAVLWGGWSWAGRFAERRLAGARVAAVSRGARDAFIEWRARAGGQPVDPVVIYNGVDLARLAEGPRQLFEPPLLCFAGRFEHQKGIDVLLESITRLTALDPPFLLAIYGAGKLGSSVADAAARWPGRVVVGPPIADLSARLGSFDAILLPSRFEGLPLLAVEAICTGVPILGTSARGLDEVFPAWYPGRCPPGDAAAFADVIRDFLGNRAAWRKQALRARPEARGRFSLETMVASYERLYAETVS